MSDGDTALVLVVHIWYTLGKQLVLTVRIQVEVPILNVYQQAQNIWLQLMEHREGVVPLLELNMSQMKLNHRQTITMSPVRCVSQLLLEPATCFQPELPVQIWLGPNSIKVTWWVLTVTNSVLSTCVWMRHLRGMVGKQMITVFCCIQWSHSVDHFVVHLMMNHANLLVWYALIRITHSGTLH